MKQTKILDMKNPLSDEEFAEAYQEKRQEEELKTNMTNAGEQQYIEPRISTLIPHTGMYSSFILKRHF